MINRTSLATAIAVVTVNLFGTDGRAEESGVPQANVAATLPNQSSEFASGFGQRGQWYLMAPLVQASHSHYDTSAGYGVDSSHSLAMELTFGKFVRDRLSLGLDVAMSYQWSDQVMGPANQSQGYADWNPSLYVVLGWQRPLGAWVSFWPSVSVGGSYIHWEDTAYDVDGNMSKQTHHGESIEGTVALPLVLHVTRHLFMEMSWVGRLSGQDNRGASTIGMTTGVTFGIGGWI